MQKYGFYRACTRGIATWIAASAYVVRRVTRGPDVTRRYYLLLYKVYRSPLYKETNYQYAVTVVDYIVSHFLHLSRVGLNLSFYFDYKRRGSVSSIG